MTYKQLIRALEIAAKYNGGMDVNIFGAIKTSNYAIAIKFAEMPSATELRELHAMDFEPNFWKDGVYMSGDYEAWCNRIDDLPDEDLLVLFEKYKEVQYW